MGPPSQFELDMQRLEDIASAPIRNIASVDAPWDGAPLDPLGAHIHGEDLGNYMAIQDDASHAVIDGPASAQCSC